MEKYNNKKSTPPEASGMFSESYQRKMLKNSSNISRLLQIDISILRKILSSILDSHPFMSAKHIEYLLKRHKMASILLCYLYENHFLDDDLLIRDELIRVSENNRLVYNCEYLIYQKALQSILRKSDYRKLCSNSSLKNLYFEMEEWILSEIACCFHCERDKHNGEVAIAEDCLITFINNRIIKENLILTSIKITAEEIITLVEKHRGILTKKQIKGIFFYHFEDISLQDYFMAQYIVDNNLIEEITNDYLSNPEWRSVFTFIPGLMRCNSKIFFKKFFEKINIYIETDNREKLDYLVVLAIECGEKSRIISFDMWIKIQNFYCDYTEYREKQQAQLSKLN